MVHLTTDKKKTLKNVGQNIKEEDDRILLGPHCSAEKARPKNSKNRIKAKHLSLALTLRKKS